MALTLTNRDRQSIWHPFTQMLNAKDSIPIVKGKGIYLYSNDGKKFMDGISSWWVNLHGHAHPYIIKKIAEQAKKLEHVIFADFTHPPAIELAEQLLKILPGKMSKIFYSDNGSTSVEVAIKMAIQYWHNKNSKTKKIKVICYNQGYHGDTFGAMSVSAKTTFNRPFWSHLFEVETIDPPLAGFEQQSLQQLELILQKGDVACFIFEPLILGVGGMRIYTPDVLNALIALCHSYQVITIADEVMTGFGRTGCLFACDQLTESPDVICLSKGITGGFLPLGATACKEFIYEAFLSEDRAKSFLHGHSYTANPLACSAALANLQLLMDDKCTLQRARIENQHKRFCTQWKGHPALLRCEYLGTILVLEYKSQEKTSYFHSLRDTLYDYFLKHEILLRPLGNVIYVMPPYCIKNWELEKIYSHLIFTIDFFRNSL